MNTTKPKVSLREAQLTGQNKRMRDKIKRMRADMQDMANAAQTVFVRCACGRIRESGIICPTNQEGGECEAGS